MLKNIRAKYYNKLIQIFRYDNILLYSEIMKYSKSKMYTDRNITD